MKIKYLIVTAFLFSLHKNVETQNSAKSELESILKEYKGDFNFSFSAKYKYYENLTTKIVSDSLDSYTRIHNDEFYFKISDYEMVGNTDYSLFVDHKSKQIVLEGFLEQQKKKRRLGYIESILQTSGATITEFDPVNGLKGFSIDYKDQQIKSADITYDPNTHRINKCTIKYLEDINVKTGQYEFSRLEIIYTNYVKKNDPIGTDYGLVKFIDLKNNKSYSIQGQFARYEFINLTPLKKN